VALLARPSSPLLLGGAAGNLLVVGIWVASRTAGLPGLPGTPEGIGLPDLLVAQMELVAVVLLLLADRRLDRPGAPRSAAGHLLRVGPGIALALLATASCTLVGLAGVAPAAGH